MDVVILHFTRKASSAVSFQARVKNKDVDLDNVVDELSHDENFSHKVLLDSECVPRNSQVLNEILL